MDEVKMTFRATLWVGQWRGLLLGIIPLYWVQFKAIKENGEPFSTVNRLILIIWYLAFLTAPALGFGRAPAWVLWPYCLALGFAMGVVRRWIREK
jgi:hypothetical protein